MTFKNNCKVLFLYYLLVGISGYATLCDSNNKQRWQQKSLRVNDRQVLTRTRVGFPMFVDGKDGLVSRMIMNYGVWEPGLANLMKHLVKPGDNVLNLGSQSGMEAIMLARQIGEKGKVFIFQPYSASYTIMRKSVYLNNLQDTVTTYNIGASNQFGVGQITVSLGNTGGSQIHQRQEFDQAKLQKNNVNGLKKQVSLNEQVVLARVDDVLPNETVLDFALIDIQKMEIQALDGMQETIRRSPNLIIFTEWQYGENPYRDVKLGTKVINFLFGQGYKFYLVSPRSECNLPQFKPLQTAASLDIRGNVNLLLIPKGHQLPNY